MRSPKHPRMLRFAILLIAGFHLSYGKVVITGKIHNYDGKTLVYYRPTLEGINAPYGEKVQPTQAGNFRIEFENEGIGSITLGFSYLYYRFFHDTNSTISIEIDQSKINIPKRPSSEKLKARHFIVLDSLKQIATLRIAGDFQEINNYYNTTAWTSFPTVNRVDGNNLSFALADIQKPEQLLVALDSMTQPDLDRINNLNITINQENLSLSNSKHDEIKKFLVTEVRIFYARMFLDAMFQKRKQHVIQKLKDSTAVIDIYNAEWEKVVESFLLQAKQNLQPIPNSAGYTDFINSIHYTMSDYKKYYFSQKPEPLDQMVVNHLFNYDTLFLPDKKSRFAYILSGLNRYLQDQLFYSPILLHAVYNLKDEYGTSAHMKHFEPLIEKLKTSLEVTQQPFNDGKVIRKEFTTLRDLLKQFEGKNVLIDVWATWCHPCVADFAYKSAIQPFIQNKQLHVVYISIDKPEWEDRWKQSIKINKLEGSHFRADEAFIKDMWKELGGYQGAIPRYALVNKSGKIVVPTADRPGNEKLVLQINELINSQ